MKDRYWMDTEDDQDRQRRRMAEFLVHGEVPTDLLVGCAVRSEQRRDQVQALLAAALRPDLFTGFRPEWYYGYQRSGGDRR